MAVVAMVTAFSPITCRASAICQLSKAVVYVFSPELVDRIVKPQIKGFIEQVYRHIR
ncbi:MAG: hypothetical protein QXO32_04995 [Candidatus Bathyarchaeia archaeon]